MAFFCLHCRSEIDPKFKACPFCGEAITDFLRKYLETPIDGKYRILSRLGVGGMGEVYKALHIHLNALRVIKLMRATIAGEEGAHERFLREARMATRIHHPNVAALFDFDTLEDGARFMVWEYIEGINLHELIAMRGPLSPRYAATLAVQALMGLDAIHRAGIIHRDISPENLMVTRDDEGGEVIKVIDLGIAKQWGEEADAKTKTGMFVGKWKYCSPEHLGMLPDGERIDGRADLYSFGIVLYEMLTGVPPFRADTPHAFLMLHANERPRSLRETNPSVTASPELEALIFRALEKDRNKRFATARDFARELEALLPSLDDEPGAQAVLPHAAEATEEPTHPIDTPTVVSLSRAQTMRTLEVKTPEPPRTAGSRELLRTDSIPAPAASRAPLAWIAAAIVAIVIAAGAYVLLTKSPKAAPQPNPIVTKPAPPPPVVHARLGINAFPWGEVTSIRNVASGESISISAPIVTPAPVELVPGKYEITLSNPSFRTPVTKTVDVQSGDQSITIQFIDPASAKLPRFDGATQ